MWDYPDIEDAIMPTVKVRKYRDIGPVIKAVRRDARGRSEPVVVHEFR